MTQALSIASAAMRWRALQLVGVQALYFVRLLILAKLLAPDAFGLLAIAYIAINVFMVLSDLGMIPALVQQRNATKDQYDGAWTVNVLRAVVVALIVILAAPLIAELFDEPAATQIIQVLALRPLIDACASIGVASLTRELKFKELALIQVPGALADFAVAILTAPALGVWALVAGVLVGSATTTAFSYVFAPHWPKWVMRWRNVAPLVRYGRWVLATGVTGLLGTLITQLAISRMLGTVALGVYFLATRTAFLPLGAVSSVVGAVAFPMFSGMRDDARGSSLGFSTLLAAMFLLLVPVYGIIFVLAPSFEQVLGTRWAGTAPIIQVVSIAAIIGIFGELLGPLLMGRGRADRAFLLEVVQTGALLVVLVPCLIWFGITGAALAWLLGNAIAMLFALAWAARLLPGAITSISRPVLAAIVVGVGGALAAQSVEMLVAGFSGLALAGIAGGAVAGVILWLLNWPMRLNLAELARFFVAGKK
jgi:lipopolysaccharide exporter